MLKSIIHTLFWGTCLMLFAHTTHATSPTHSATASSVIADLVPYHAVDGDPASFWSSQGHGPNPLATEWIEIDFGQVLPLYNIVLTPRLADGTSYGFPSDYRIEYSYDDAGDYFFPVPDLDFEDVSTPTAALSHFVPGDILARRIRITATELRPDNFGNHYFQLAEVEIETAESRPPFRTAEGGDFDARLNMLWYIFGSVSDGTEAVFDFGNEPAFHAWMADKYSWHRDTRNLAQDLRNGRLVPWAQSADGYLWSWIDSEEWPTGEGAVHMENNAKFIYGCWRYWSWTRDDSFFTQTDPNSVTTPSRPSRPDISQGRNLRDKLRLAMQFLEQKLQGDQGGILIEDTDFDPDGTRTDGTLSGDPTNYWDNLRLGYKNAYDNIYYYVALEAMAQLEEHWGDAPRARQLRAYADGVRAEYDSTFWDPAKGRYIGCVDKNGTAWDFGFPFLNLEALWAGLGDADKAASIFEWLDGQRIIAGETSTGADIYHWGFAPRANTVAIETIGPPYWWEDLGGAIRVDNAGAQYGNHLENGGAIFYVSYFDLMARLRHLGPDNALERLRAILDEFQTDQLRRDPAAPGSAPWQLGIIGEFPESGLVPCFVAYGFAGLEPGIHGLMVKPQLPTSWPELELRDVAYRDSILDFHITPGRITVHSDPSSADTLYFEKTPLPPGGSASLPYTPGERGLLLDTEPVPVTLSETWTRY